MQENFELQAELRTEQGKGASRRLRRTGKVPAILYGGDADPVSLQMAHSELIQHLDHEAFYSHILKVNFDGTSEQAVLRDVQRHPAKPFILHIDLQRVSAKEELRMNVPLHFLNEETAPGVRNQGGIVNRTINELEILCLPKDLPEYIEVDLGSMEVGDAIHLSEIKLPAGVSLVEEVDEEHDQPVVTIVVPRAVVEEEPEEGEAEAEAQAAEAGEEGDAAPSDEDAEGDGESSDEDKS